MQTPRPLDWWYDLCAWYRGLTLTYKLAMCAMVEGLLAVLADSTPAAGVSIMLATLSLVVEHAEHHRLQRDAEARRATMERHPTHTSWGEYRWHKEKP